MSGRSVNLTGRVRSPKRLTITSFTYFRQELTTALLVSAKGETKVCGQTGYRTQDPGRTSQVPYRLRYAARREGILSRKVYNTLFGISLKKGANSFWKNGEILHLEQIVYFYL